MNITTLNLIGAIGLRLILVGIFLFMFFFSLIASWHERKEAGGFYAIAFFWVFVILCVMAVLPHDVNWKSFFTSL